MIKKIIFFLAFIFISLHLFAENEWTVLVYIAADNSLSQQSFKDVNEMEAVEESDSVQFLIQIDPLDDPSYPPYFSTSRRYLIRHDNNPDSIGSLLIDDLGEINSADPQTLADFANWGFSYAPSTKKMVIIWDHGNGWYKDDEQVKSVCYDNSFNDRMGVANGELREAISAIDHHIDILVFDACSMQTTEVITEFYEYCDIVAASELSVPVDGILYGATAGTACSQYGLFNYLSENPLCSPITLSAELVYRYINSYTTNCQNGSTISFSAIDVTQYDFYLQRLRQFTDIYSDSLYRDVYHIARNNCFQINTETVDIWDFLNETSLQSKQMQDDAAEIASLIDSMTILHSALYNDVIYPELGRMSVYFPKTQNSFNWQHYYPLQFNFDTKWERFLSYNMDYYDYNPVIINFSVSSVSELVNFSWEVVASTDLSYQLFYKTETDTCFVQIQDSSITHATSFSQQFAPGDYEFKLRAIDEFANETSTIKEHLVSLNFLFSFYPNPLNVNDHTQGTFIISAKDLTDAKIIIYNLGGEHVDTINIDDSIGSTIKVDYIPKNVSSGIYFCLLDAGNAKATIKLAIIR